MLLHAVVAFHGVRIFHNSTEEGARRDVRGMRRGVLCALPAPWEAVPRARAAPGNAFMKKLFLIAMLASALHAQTGGVRLDQQVQGTLPISQGGTGATTSAGARSNLGLDDGVVPRYSAGSGAPAGSCVNGRDYYVDTLNNTLYFCSGTAWRLTGTGGSSDHGALSGLGDDDHVQYIRVDGGRAFTGMVRLDNLGVDFMESESNPACGVGDFRIYADQSEGALKKCQNGTVTDLDTGAGAANYQSVADEGSPLAQRAGINFTGSGIACVDDAGNGRTTCTVSASAGSPVFTQSTSAPSSPEEGDLWEDSDEVPHPLVRMWLGEDWHLLGSPYKAISLTLAEPSAIVMGGETAIWPLGPSLTGWHLSSAQCDHNSVGSGGSGATTVSMQLCEATSASANACAGVVTDILATDATIDTGERSTVDATSAAVANIGVTVQAGDFLQMVVGSTETGGTAPQGLVCTAVFAPEGY